MENVRAVLFSRLIRYLGYLQGVKDFKKKILRGPLFFISKDTNDKTVFWGKFTENLRKFNKLLFLYFINSKLTGKCRRQIWVLTFPESLVIKHFHTSKL